MSHKGLSSHQTKTFTRAFYDYRAYYVGWSDPDELEYFDLPDDHLPTEELENLLQSIRFEMTNNDWERVKDMETINLEDFKAIMINKVNSPEEIMGARSYGGRFLDNQLFNSNEDSDGSDEPHSLLPSDDPHFWTNVSLDTIHEWAAPLYPIVRKGY